MLQHQRALSEIVQRQRRQHQLQPPVSDRDPTEVTEIGVERLTSGDHEKHRGEHDERLQAIARKELDSAQRIQRREYVRRLHDLHEAEQAKHQEPDDDNRTEHSAHSFGAFALHGEQRCEYDDRDGHDNVLELGRRHCHPFNRAQHRDRGREDSIAEEQGCAQDADGGDRLPTIGSCGLRRPPACSATVRRLRPDCPP